MKKTLRISISILLLALAVAVTQIPAGTVSADASQSTTSDFWLDGNTLIKYTGTALSVSVPASVKVISAEAFAGHPEMEKLSFAGKSVESIGYRAFAGCSGLREVQLPDSVQELGNGAFDQCVSLEKVTFGTGLKELGVGVFGGDTSLKQIVVPKDNTAFVVNEGCLYDAAQTRLCLVLCGRDKSAYVMPESVTDIAEYAFANVEDLTSVSLGSKLSEIPAYAFAGCVSLAGITIPYSVRSIDLKAFADCVNLEMVTIPSNVTYIHDTAFDGCPRLRIIANAGSVAADFYEKWKTRNQAEYEDTGNASAEEEPDREPENNEITYPSGYEVNSGQELGSSYVVANRAVLFIDNSASPVYGTDAGQSQTGGQGQENGPQDDGSGGSQTDDAQNAGGADGTENGYSYKGTEIPKYTVAFGSVLADMAFYMNRDIADYQIPDGIAQIGEFAFARSNITRAYLPKGTTSIGYGAFYHCDSLREVRIPSTVTYIAPKAFEKSLWLQNWLSGTGDDYLVVGDGILLAYRGKGGNITIPDNVKRIAPEAFYGNVKITAVTLPDSVTEIGEDAFGRCANLKNVYGGAGVTAIKDRAFAGCVLETAHVWKNVKYVGLMCFDYSEASTSISNKLVVFDGRELPARSSELTAQRLSNAQARGRSLGDALIAVVDKKTTVQDLEGTVLDLGGAGFQGVIMYISSKDRGLAVCLATTLTKEEYQNTYIPDYITVDGRTYQVTGKGDITEFGRENDIAEGEIVVENESESIKGSVSASLSGGTLSGILTVRDDEAAYEALNAAYEAVYREKLPAGALCIDVTLCDAKTRVPITKMGSQQLLVTLTIPGNLANSSLRVLTVDRNGQLENLPYSRSGETVTFRTSHLSPFAFCCVAGHAQAGNLDKSPDTGDPIHPKWFVAAGLASLAVAVLFMRRTRKR